MGCNGLHCDGCRHGGGPAAATVVLLLFIALAVRAEWHAIAATVELIGWCLLGTAATAGAVTLAVMVARARHASRDRLPHPAVTMLLPPDRYHVIPPASVDEPARHDTLDPPRPRLYALPGGRQRTRAPRRRWPR